MRQNDTFMSNEKKQLTKVNRNVNWIDRNYLQELITR